ncbi:MAG: hypothetical protein MJZ04_00220 [Bacteroidales bacterium]|nr:hypothetical protein [Bacteroidales bacterium]
MVLLGIALLILAIYLFLREGRRDTLIGNSRIQQIQTEKEFCLARKNWMVIGGVCIAVAVFMFLFCHTGVINHYSSGKETESLSGAGLFAYLLLWGGGILSLLGLKSYSNHDLNTLKYQSMSDSDYDDLRQRAYEQKMKEEEAARNYRTMQRNMKIGNAIGTFLSNL